MECGPGSGLGMCSGSLCSGVGARAQPEAGVRVSLPFPALSSVRSQLARKAESELPGRAPSVLRPPAPRSWLSSQRSPRCRMGVGSHLSALTWGRETPHVFPLGTSQSRSAWPLGVKEGKEKRHRDVDSQQGCFIPSVCRTATTLKIGSVMAEMQPGSCQSRNSAHSLRPAVHVGLHFPLPKHPSSV